jgi:AraC-like DNA-binding protein
LLDGGRHHPPGPRRQIGPRLSVIHIELDRIFIGDSTFGLRPGSQQASTLPLRCSPTISAKVWLDEWHRNSWFITATPAGNRNLPGCSEPVTRATDFHHTGLELVRARLDERLPVERLADDAATSTRHFARAFATETNVIAGKAIERLRPEHACGQVENGAEPIESVVTLTGFGIPNACAVRKCALLSRLRRCGAPSRSNWADALALSHKASELVAYLVEDCS